MTRKDYIRFAKIIKDNTLNDNTLYKDGLIFDMCLMFAKDNKLFSRQRFLNACE